LCILAAWSMPARGRHHTRYDCKSPSLYSN
jgi:hypothetical protein